MKYLILLLVALSAHGEMLQGVAPVEENQKIAILNSYIGAECDENHYCRKQYSFGDSCWISVSGYLVIRGAVQDSFLVVYSTSSYNIPERCPAGSMFFWPKQKFLDARERMIKKSAPMQKSSDRIKRIIDEQQKKITAAEAKK